MGTNLGRWVGAGRPPGGELRHGLVRLSVLILVTGAASWWPATSAGAEGPLLLKDIRSGSAGSLPETITVVGSTAYFVADDGAVGKELWKSDGTAAGTVLVKDIRAGGTGSAPTDLTAVGSTLFFAATDATYGKELWKSNGTAAGTAMVKDIATGAGSGYPGQFAAVGSVLFFTAWDATNGSQLWKSDGTGAGTARVTTGSAQFFMGLTSFRGMLLFGRGGPEAEGMELWKSDGTSAGTVRVKDINPGPGGGLASYGPGGMAVVGTILFFIGDDGVHGEELWKTDGTAAGTAQVRDITPGSCGSEPRLLTPLGGVLFFVANGTELWRTDGTEAGTALVEDLWGRSGSEICRMSVVGDLLLFAAADPAGGWDLWRSDGTEAGTLRTARLGVGLSEGSPNSLTAVNSVAYFPAADAAHGNELWCSDGTCTGTVLTGDINPGAADSAPQSTANLNGRLLFCADDGTRGGELWSMAVTNWPPTVSLLPKRAVLKGIPVSVSFTVGDVETHVSALQVSVVSSNQELLPDPLHTPGSAHLVLGGAGANRTLTLTPVAGRWGTAEVAIHVSDGQKETVADFPVVWQTDLLVVGAGGDYANNELGLAVEHAADGAVVLLRDGVYTLDDPLRDGSATVRLDGGRDLTIRSENGPETTTIDLQFGGQAFVVLHGGTATTIEGLTIANGSVDDTGGGQAPGGGAILIGGAAADSEAHRLTIADCVFHNNTAANFGGAIAIRLRDPSNGVVITGCTFAGNGTDNAGGAVGIFPYLYPSPAVGSVAITDCRFSGNTANRGGAVAAGSESFLAVAGHAWTLRRCVFDRNVAWRGGAVSDGQGFCRVSECVFSQNRALEYGGAVAACLPPAFTNCVFLQNEARQDGGALWTEDPWYYEASMVQTGRDAEATTITHCTFAGNHAGSRGGGIHAAHNLVVSNSILWGNTAASGSQVCTHNELGTGYALRLGHSDIDGGLSGIPGDGGTGTALAVENAGGLLQIDPQFALAEDLHLMPASPCLDAGAASPPGGLPATDLEGNDRAEGAAPDQGAYEQAAAPSPFLAVSPTRLVFATTLGGPLPEGQTLSVRSRSTGTAHWVVREAISWLRAEPVEGTSTGETDAVRLYADPSGLARGSYTDSLRLTDGSGAGLWGEVEVSLCVTGELRVPEEYGTIQAAIYAAIDGDAVVVSSGVYSGPGNTELDFLGRAITLRSEDGPNHAIIDCEGQGRAFHFRRVETQASVLNGFTIRNGTDPGGGGGIFVEATSSPRILNCVFEDNSVPSGWWGGGILVRGPSTYIGGCHFLRNTGYGGAIYVGGDLTTIEDCTFTGNVGNQFAPGAAIAVEASGVTINACSFYANTAVLGGKGGGISVGEYGASSGSVTTISNSRFVGNRANVGGALYVTGAARTSIYNCVLAGNEATVSGCSWLDGAGNGGAVLFRGTEGALTHCTFHANSAEGLGGGVFVTDGYSPAALTLANCILRDNYQGTGGGRVLADVGPCISKTVTMTDADDRVHCSGHGFVYGSSVWFSSSGALPANLSTLMWYYVISVAANDFQIATTYGGTPVNFGSNSTPVTTAHYRSYPEATVSLSYSLLSDQPADPSRHISNADPLFVDVDGSDGTPGTADDDLRLGSDSPGIDAGKKIQWLFSDMRGSLRPVDVPGLPRDSVQSSSFDLGAYEFSEDYGGIAGDLPTKAFREVKAGGALVVTHFEYNLEWKDKDPFPYDGRISQPQEYAVNLALVSEAGLRVELGAYTVAVSQHGYSVPYTFGTEHIGTWQLRVELVSDPTQFALSEAFSIEYKQATRYALSQWIPPPEGADPAVQPDVAEEDACHWSVETDRLYAIAPITTVITWYADEERTNPLPVVAYITYPDRDRFPSDPLTQIHIADSMAVDLLPVGTPFDLAEIMYAGNDATLSGNTFSASLEGWALVIYRDQQADDAADKECFDVVRTLAWDHQDVHHVGDPSLPLEAACEIGTEITDDEHCAECGSGYVLFENARYDGWGESRAYDRQTRQGPIVAVNEDEPGTEQDDLVVIWYNQSPNSGVCWPSKPVRYEALWPLDARAMVIASQLGSGPLDPARYGAIDEMLIYNQPDRTQPGYNPNEEHATLFTALNSSLPAVFALRTDLNRPADDLLPYQDGDRSRSYVLLKYHDPAAAQWAFEVFKVVAQSGRYLVAGGRVVPADGSDTRYGLDQGGLLVPGAGDASESPRYCLDAQGLLVRRGVTAEAWYNRVGGVIGPVAYADVMVYHLNAAGQLVERGLLADHPDLPPSPSYALDAHGVLVDYATYYRFHYPATAGQQISPPYPLDLASFGPCPESYTSTDAAILEDKDHRFHAVHGGLGGDVAADGVLHLFYRLQPGFWLDLDENGVTDRAAGAPLAWLAGLDGTDDDEPVAVTYAIAWPAAVPSLFVGETLTGAKTQEGETVGLPDVAEQCVVELRFDQSVAAGGAASAKLVDPLFEHAVSLAETAVPTELRPEFGSNSREVFKALPAYLQNRLTYDYVTAELKLKGIYQVGTGEPLLLLNTLTQRDIMEISRPFLPDPNRLDPETWTAAAFPPGTEAFRTALYALKDAGDAGLQGAATLKEAQMKALTAGAAQNAPAYVTLAFNNDPACPGSVTLSVVRVNCPLYRGTINVIESDDSFEEKVTLRHSGDFGGQPGTRWFQWKYLPAGASGIPLGPGQPGEDWQDYFAVLPTPGAASEAKDPSDPGRFYQGAVDLTVQGTGQQLLPDRWFAVRYYYANESATGPCAGRFSAWTSPQLYEGWIKRVMKRINLFDQKVKDFHRSDIDTLVSMISQAGRRYEGDVALCSDPECLKQLGIIEAYETLLRRAKALTLEQGEDAQDSNAAILFAANRLAGLYLLLGNEAYADATDPTIGFSTADGQYGTEAPSIFCFQNQVDSLLDEELALLRGRDSAGVQPFYNRLIWNFTLGDGEVAYKESYDITDQETDADGDGVPEAPDGSVDERDAMVLFPQGHGDSWGHYLTAGKYYYDLLRHPSFTWTPQAEAILVDHVPVPVDYRDERQFAVAAAAKARSGAEIVNLTYRRRYVEDPAGQWQGYKDSDANRAWGVDDWGRRAGQGALFDWIVGNAVLPPDDAAHDGIAKVDRTTVVELREVASRYAQVQAELDTADVGLNPLGLAKGVVPFDIDPSAIANGQTHFEQIYERAVQAMNNAITVFNHANQSTMLLRRQQDTLAGFKRHIENTEADFNSRLIEVFGYPYADDCGPGKTYQAEYAETGPDLYHYMYVDPSELMGVEAPKTHEFVVTFRNTEVDAMGTLQQTEQEVLFHVATDGRFGFIKPPAWQGRRKAPGEIQLVRSDLLQARGRFEKALVEYENLLGHIEKQADLIAAEHDLNAREITVLRADLARQSTLNAVILGSRLVQRQFQAVGGAAVVLSDALAEAWPQNTGFIAGLAAGVIADVFSAPRSAIKLVGHGISQVMSRMATLSEVAELGVQQAKETTAASTNIQLTALRGGFAVKQELLQLENLIRTEATLRLEIYNLTEGLQQTAGRYLVALAHGERLLQDRLRFRRQTAAQVQDYRYKDMTFRIFRNDALQRYRAQFDLAARYVYLAAKAYDYETTLLDHDTMAGRAFLTDIVRQRTIGLVEGGIPLTGTGLADPMKRMWQNFLVLKPQLGFTNPQQEANRFSLRQELFRIRMDEGSNDTWRQALEAHRVADLWEVQEFRRYCRPFAAEGVAQPGIVIPFSTTVTAGQNFFGWPLGGGDSYYSATHFATKVRSVGVWFSNYNSVNLVQTPRIYLVPAGEDLLRTPAAVANDIRAWQVVDQKLPTPFPVVPAELSSNPGWIPTVNTIFDEMFQVRRHSDFRAYHDSGYVNESEMVFDSRLVGRSVWNTRWLLIIPGQSLLYDAQEGIDRFIYGPLVLGSEDRAGNGVWDIKLFFHTYAYSGN